MRTQGLWHNSENKRYLLASGRSLQSGTWKDWMSISQCAAELPCLNALHDEAQPLNAFTGLMCLWMSYAVALTCFHCCLCAVYFMASYQWRRHLTSCLFLSVLVRSRWSICPEWVDFQAKTTHSTIYTQSVLGWASLSFEGFFSVCGILAFLVLDHSVARHRGNIMRQRQKRRRKKRKRRA